jgi:hypothetical protein
MNNNNIRPSVAYIDQDRAQSLTEKWGPVLDYTSSNVKAIEDDHTRLNTAILLENQEQWCLRENVAGGTSSAFGGGTTMTGIAQGGSGALGTGDDYAQGDARLPKVLIPMIRRTFPELITNEIVGVQPMSGPVGLAFALRYKYDGTSLGNGIGGADDSSTSTDRAQSQPAETLNRGEGNKLAGEVGFQNLDTRFTGNSSAALSGSTSEAGSAFEMLDEDTGIADLLANFEITGDIPQMSVSFEKTAVEAGTRRLAARWSVELEQDLKNMNGIDIDNELTNAMSYEIQAEIDREMLMRMVQTALTAGNVSVWKPSESDARWMAERNRDLYSKIVVEANRIAVRNRRGAANFLVATPRVCAILEMLPEFQWMQVQGNVNTQPVGIARVGNLGGRFNVYRDTRTEAQNFGDGTTSARTKGGSVNNELNYVLLGYKGPEFYDTGIVYCPYIPVMVQRTIGPNDFAPRVGLLTRYGVVDNIFGAELYYSVIIVKELGTNVTVGSTANYM